nr:auxilin-like protein [Tanacetum cinerariifolium]
MLCVKHIHENMKSEFKEGFYKDMLWNAAIATTIEFNKKMAQLKSYNFVAYDWFIKIPTEQWSRSHFPAGYAALKAGSCKVTKREKACIENQHVFISFAFDTFGFLAPEAVELLSRVQRVMHSNVMTPRSTDVVVTLSKSHLKSTMACALHQHLTGLTLVDRPIVVKTDDPFDDLDEILERVGPMGNFKEEEVDTNNETEEESNDEMFDDDEHILEDVLVSMNSFNSNPYPKYDLSIDDVEVHELDLDAIDYDSSGSSLDDRFDYERRTQLRELRRISK